MSEEVAVRIPSGMELDDSTMNRVVTLRSSLQDFGVDDLQATIIWADAVAAAGKAKRAWTLAREASELQVRAERKLGQILSSMSETFEEMTQRMAKGDPQGISPGRPIEVKPEVIEYIRKLHSSGLGLSEIARTLNEEGVTTPRGGEWYPSGIKRVLGHRTTLIDPRKEGMYMILGSMPEDLFTEVVEDLLERGLGVNPSVVIRNSRRHSLELMDEGGIHRSWDGIYFTSGPRGYKRSKKETLDEVREEMYAEARMSKKSPRTGAAKLVDEAFAEARRDAQQLSALRNEVGGRANDLVAEAELLQAKVASLLFEAYREVQIRLKELKPMKIPR
jgi:hypothetical protein